MDTSTSVLLASAIVVGVCAVIKSAGVKKRFLPLCGLAIGVLLSWVIPELTILGGIIGGLSAFGLYRGVELTAGKA